MEEEIERTKLRAKWGCGIWAMILILGPILFIEWKSVDTATITLFGEEQYPETIEFNSGKDKLFKNVQIDLDTISLTTSESPDGTNMIEIREIIRSQGEKPRRFLRIYYGVNGSILEKYKE